MYKSLENVIYENHMTINSVASVIGMNERSLRYKIGQRNVRYCRGYLFESNCNETKSHKGDDIIKALEKTTIWIMLGVLVVRAFITNDSDTLHLMTATFLIYWQLDSIKEDIVDEIKKGVDKHEN